MLLAIGELLADIISTEFVDSLADARTFSIYQGGSPSNVCANVKWLGMEAQLVASVGNDGLGKMLIEQIAQTGLDTSHIHIAQNYPSSLVLVGRSKGTPDFTAYRMADTQILEVSDELINRASILHSCAFALSKDPARKNILKAFANAVEKGKSISVDWNFAPSIWRSDFQGADLQGRGEGMKVFEQLCGYKPLLKFSMDDIERFQGITHVDEAKRFLSNYNTSLTCLTMGKDGVWFKTNENWQFMPADPVQEVLDTTGAGDAFWAGVLTSWMTSKDATVAVKEGLRVAALKVQKQGPLYLNL